MNAQHTTGTLVLGMHRSGTSATAGALAAAGFHLGDDLLEAGADNPRGYWEHAGVVAINERLLSALGRRWDDPRPMPAGWQDGEAAQAASDDITRLLERLAQDRAPWAIKDPRLCRLLPLWMDAMARCGVRPALLFVARQPLEVADSLAARDGWTRAGGVLLWLRHVLEAAEASAGHARTCVTFDAILHQPFRALAPAMHALGLPPLREAAAHDIRAAVHAGDRHHANAAPMEAGTPLEALAQRAWEALVRNDATTWQTLADASDSLDLHWRRHGDVADAIAAIAAVRDTAHLECERTLVVTRSALAAQVRWSHEAVAKEEALHERVETLRHQIAHVQDAAAATSRALAIAQQQLDALERDRALILASASWRVTRPLRAARRWLRRCRPSSLPGTAQ